MAIKLTQQDLKYINEIKAYAIQNPEWFWSNADDATEARQWLYSHGASGIVDEIYQETPDNIKQTIDDKKLSTSSQFNKFHEKWKDDQEDASKAVAGTLAVAGSAPFAIGGLTSAASTGALGNAGRYALGKADDAIAWLSKPGTRWYDPRHIAQAFLDPRKAYTGVGQAAFATADLAGAGYSAKNAATTVDRWTKGDFHHGDIPQVALDVLGATPAINYLSKMGVSVPRGVYNLYDNTVRSFNDMKNEVQPALGIRAHFSQPQLYNEFETQQALARLNEQRSRTNRGSVPTTRTTSEVITTAPRPQQYSSLSQDVIQQLNRIGLGRYDIQNLLDRGFSTEEILRLTDTQTPGQRYNYRAQILEQRLNDMGISPSLPTRQAYLQSIVDNGGTLLEHNRRPYSMEEWNEMDDTAGLNPMDHEWSGGMDWIRNVFYGRPRTNESGVALTPITITPPTQSLNSVENDAMSMFESLDAFSDLRRKLRSNIDVFGDDEFQVVQPEIKRILVDGISSRKPVDEIEAELDALYAQYDKPFSVRLGSIGSHRAHADIEEPRTWDIHSAIFRGQRPSRGISVIRRNPYTSTSDLPYIVHPGQELYSPTSFVVFDAPGSEVANMHRKVMQAIPHGGITYDVHKSMQSTPMANRNYTTMIKRGDGIGTFLPSGHEWDVRYGDGYNRRSQYMPNDGYYYRKTNDFAGAMWHPRRSSMDMYSPGVNAQTAEQMLGDNISTFEDFLNVVDPRVFSEMGGYPKYGIEIDGTYYDLPISKGVRSDGTPGLIIQRSDAVNDAVRKFDDSNEQILGTRASWDQFKTKTQDLISRYHPDGQDAILTQNAKGVYGIKTKDGQFKSLSSYAQENPNFANEYQPIVSDLNSRLMGHHLNGDQRTALMGDDERVFMHAPVSVLRVRKYGGIIDNLNKSTKKLLNII